MMPGSAAPYFPGEVLNPNDAWDMAKSEGINDLFRDEMDMGTWHSVLNRAAVLAEGRRFGEAKFQFREPETGALIVWVAILRKRNEPEIEHENLYEVVGFQQIDVDNASVL